MPPVELNPLVQEIALHIYAAIKTSDALISELPPGIPSEVRLEIQRQATATATTSLYRKIAELAEAAATR